MLPARNRKDLEDIPETCAQGDEVRLARRVEDALAAALEGAEGARRASDEPARRKPQRRQEEPTDGTLTGRKSSRGGAERAAAA